ncbi:hemolysin-activating ACP:hemolysin acyltransferase [Tahibacter aquaticus]|uniref:RTX toxin-activating lysine-acyltransferase n=1 Tax=Tahibacter aquaticus TaxID=520092 RepID=A0A4V3DLV5_9GAMM|nr:toxin-activating lysine-acyltransferase [Tahibacter aquaticus]TDR41254.1 hemolysin-activating ACP:hemolysin acyltransferase [Tahibacter aquaticus]
MSARDLGPVQDPASIAFSRALGVVTQLTMRSPHYRAMPLAALAIWVEPAIRLGQIELFFDARGIAAGYISWALVSDETLQRLCSDGTSWLHFSEWNEGDNLWIVDMFARPGHVCSIARRARDGLFAACSTARWLRRRVDGSVRRLAVLRRRRQ